MFLADRILSTVALMIRCCVHLSVVCTECIVTKRCVLEQKLPLTAYRKSYSYNYEKSIGTKMNDVDLV